jgi:SulP family sulfate permease
VRMRNVSLLDSTGLRALRDVVRSCHAQRTLVLVAEIHAQPMAALEHSPALEELGAGQIYMTLEDALDRAREHLATRQPTPVAPFPAVKREEKRH